MLGSICMDLEIIEKARSLRLIELRHRHILVHLVLLMQEWLALLKNLRMLNLFCIRSSSRLSNLKVRCRLEKFTRVISS